MCFEFEALYWAKLAEEEEKRKESENQRKAAQGRATDTPAKPHQQPAYDKDPLPV